MTINKPLNRGAILIVAMLSLATGAFFGFSAGNFGVRGISTFVISSLIAYIVYALIARAVIK